MSTPKTYESITDKKPLFDCSEIYDCIMSAKEEFKEYIESDEFDSKDKVKKMLLIGTKGIEDYLDLIELEYGNEFLTFAIMELCTLKVEYDEDKFDEMSPLDFAMSFEEIYNCKLVNGEHYVENMPDILDEVIYSMFFDELVEIGLEKKLFKQEGETINLTPESV